MNVTSANILNVFYDFLKGDFISIYRYGYPPNKEGEFLVLNFIPNTRDRIKTSATEQITHGLGYCYVSAFVPKINNGDDVYPDSSRIATVQETINNLIDSFMATTKANSVSLYLDTDPTVDNDIQSHSTVIFRVTVNYS